MVSSPLFFSDLKPNNIVLTKDGHVRLIDFGLASNLQDGKLKVLPRQIARYSSPEVWNKKPAGLASDWFAYGVIIAYLYQLRLPFDGNTEEEIRKNVDSGKLDLNKKFKRMGGVKEFILKLLEVDPEKRLSKVAADKFFKDITPQPFKPGNIEIPSIEPQGEARYFSEKATVYDTLEANVIRIPPPEFFASDYYYSI